MKLLVFAASRRKASVNRKLAQLAADIAKSRQAHIDFLEYSAFDLPVYDDETYDQQALPKAVDDFAAHLQKSDGIILASPEYNWSFPGSLKNIIDWVSTIAPNPFAEKTALLLSASPSLRGGAQGLVHLQSPLMALGMHVFPRLFTLSRADTAFDKDGGLTDPKLTAELQGVVNHFVQYTKALKASG
jgi:chromate reductase, NAD(P)H dehydrogenase (quinone)